jgi:hypothetical protein
MAIGPMISLPLVFAVNTYLDMKNPDTVMIVRAL